MWRRTQVVVPEMSPSDIQPSLDEMMLRSDLNRLKLHQTKSKELLINFPKQPRYVKPVQVEGRELEVVKTAKILSLVVSDELK